MVQTIDVLPLHFYLDYQWLIDFTFCSVIIYMITELYYTIMQPASEFNLSMMWCLLVAGFSFKVLYSLTAMYFRTEDSGERILCVLFGFFFLVLAMGILIIDEGTLDFGIVKGYRNFSTEAQEFLKGQGMTSAGPATLTTFRIILAIFASILGAFLTFPGLRLAKMHTDSLKYASDRPFKQLLLHINMIFPLVITLLWISPLTKQYIVDKTYNGRTLINAEQFEVVRITLVLLFCFFRFLLCWTHMQAHLNLAHEKIAALRREAGRISNVQLQRIVSSVFYYLCAVALQYLAPIVFLLSCVFMLKTLGDYSFISSFNIPVPFEMRNASVSPTLTHKDTDDIITSTSTEFSLALASLKQVFTPLYFRGIMSFLCWWVCTCWFTTCAFGMVYYSYFTVM